MEQRPATSDNGARGSAELWLNAAREALLDGGIDAVKILPLAKRLGLSRTSFYWFFRDRGQLLEALIGLWREKNTGSLAKRADAYAESVAEAMLNVFDCWIDNDLFDSRFEFAMRSWALQSPSILAEIRDADHRRITALTGMFRRFGHDEGSADVRARTVYLTQIGYITMQEQEDLPARMPRMANYVAIFTGQAPEQRELDRFFARHGYSETVP
ncbi:TetR family transcriptional regulator [Zhengella mangrovi]|uniref:TetR family transcriptional regulator n=1 Tax=Zhengella mangrovi TaxID=1982044 RepID=A0A2G1QGR9_9HYPH|nr:TetR/AcrR family transcriptional regulator [Zhengella mangrovi]PHP64654.1 TetR family transcriptional regulator [Zhengella mangrovi]